MAEPNAAAVFQDIARYLAANGPSATEPGGNVRNLLRLLFCRFHDPDTPLETDRIPERFAAVKAACPTAFNSDEEIRLSPRNLDYITDQLNRLPATADRQEELIGAAYQGLTSREQRAGQGQFFTPANVTAMMVELLAPPPGARIIDPACGAGGFLAAANNYARQQVHAEPFRLTGMERDSFTAAFARAQLSLAGNADYRIHCLDSLANSRQWPQEAQEQIPWGQFDLVLANPPFGTALAIADPKRLEQYQLGRRWSQKSGQWRPTASLLKRQQPQLLFLERCLELLTEGGRLGIILPDGNLSNPSERYVREYLAREAAMLAVVSLPAETFQPYTNIKASALFVEKRGAQRSIFMAIAPTAGRDNKGRPLYKRDPASGREIHDDAVAGIARLYHGREEPAPETPVQDPAPAAGYQIQPEELRDRILLPGCYHPGLRRELDALRRTGQYKLTSIGELVRQGLLQISRGVEISAEHYNTGNIPYIRTTDLGNWELSEEPPKRVSPEVYEQYRRRQNLREEDILLVNDGAFLIGRSAMLTRLDLRCIIQSHFRILRVTDPERLNPHYLFYLLNTNLAKRQFAAKTIVQGTIATLGNRLPEVELPFSRDPEEREQRGAEIAAIIASRTAARVQTRKLLAGIP